MLLPPPPQPPLSLSKSLVSLAACGFKATDPLSGQKSQSQRIPTPVAALQQRVLLLQRGL